MDRGRLEGYLDRGMSLAEIGRLEGRDPSTVGYWVKKHGLVANGSARHAPRGGLAKEDLKPLVAEGLALEAIADRLDRSITTVRYWITRHQLESPKAVRRRDRDLALARGERVLQGTRDRHGETVFVIENSGRSRCRRCRMDGVAEWRRRAKARLVQEAGGRCSLCGYERCQAALEFDHLDPTTKSFALSLKGITRSMDALRAEAAKCALLCANCHAEVEVGYSTI